MKQHQLVYPISPASFSDEKLTVSYLKQALTDFQQWSLLQFKQQADIEQLIYLRSHFIDQLLKRLWSFYQISDYNCSLFSTNHLALIAVGGYGRAELHPLSDIDILILSDKPLSPELEKKVSHFLHHLWDLHLDIGHSVRTLKHCLQEAKGDISIMTNLIEARFITGNKALYLTLRDKIFSHKIWRSTDFYQAKVNEQAERHKRYHGTSYNLEPDLKNSPGGLRDLQTIQWIAIRYYGIDAKDEISQLNYLTSEEMNNLKQYQQFLWRMRFALHSVINRYDNRLLFERQLSIAKLLNYQGEGNEPVEKMMRDYYQVAHNITELNQMLLQVLQESILTPLSACKPIDIDEHFQIRDTLIDIKNDDIFIQQPITILKLFEAILHHKAVTGLHFNTIRQLRVAKAELSQLLSDQPQARQLFMQIIKHPDAIKKAILPLHQYGILAMYIPGWEKIVGMMQFDLFHAYTVDEHTIRLLLELDNLRTDAGKQKHPNSAIAYANLNKPELLIIAGLFHDIAKGQEGDHSTLGALQVEQFCKLHGIDEKDSKLIRWLVRNHLLLSVTAQSRDMQDPQVINDFVQHVKNKRYLHYLLCLTVADVCATNETLWNSWKQSLIRQLYFTAQEVLDLETKQLPEMRNLAKLHKQEAFNLLLKKDYQENKIKALWKDFRLDYFMRYNPKQIVWHAQHLLTHDLNNSLVMINPDPIHGGTEIFIYAPDKPYLFATVCFELNRRNLMIHEALIITNKSNFALDTFIVLEPNGNIVQLDRYIDIQNSIEKALSQFIYKPYPIKPLKQRLRSFSVATEIKFSSNLSDSRTYMELTALDRPGLLAAIGEVFANLGLSLHSAKIVTIGEQVEDFFILTNQHNRALDDKTCYELRDALINTINTINSMN